MTEHWQRMLDHLDTESGTPYTWPGREVVQHGTAPKATHDTTTSARELQERAAAIERETQAQREAERVRAAERRQQIRRIPPPATRPTGPHL